MKKYASQFNEIIVLAADKEKSKKKGGSMAAILKLVQDLAEFESNIQEAIDAQEIVDNKNQIEQFLQDIDKMYEVLLGMAKASIQTMRSERVQPQEPQESKNIEEVPEKKTEENPTRFTASDLRTELEKKPYMPVSVNIPTPPKY